jgi:hypothetical protein
MADIDLALHGVYAEAFAETGVRIDSGFPGPDRLPALVIGRAGGYQDWPAGSVDRPRIDLDAYAVRRQQAITLLTDAVALMHSLEGSKIRMRDGTQFVVNAVDDESGLLTDQDDSTAQGINRATMAVVLTIHQFAPEFEDVTQLPEPVLGRQEWRLNHLSASE